MKKLKALKISTKKFFTRVEALENKPRPSPPKKFAVFLCGFAPSREPSCVKMQTHAKTPRRKDAQGQNKDTAKLSEEFARIDPCA
jgi:hypothetical protein